MDGLSILDGVWLQPFGVLVAVLALVSNLRRAVLFRLLRGAIPPWRGAGEFGGLIPGKDEEREGGYRA